MKTSLLMLAPLALLFVVPAAYGELDLSNEKITSTDDNLILEFSQNTVKHFRTHTDVTPNIEYGIVDMGNYDVLLDDARVNVLGDSFTVKNDYISLYARNLGDDKFSINAYTFTDSGLQKKTFTATIVEPQRTEYVAPEPVIEEPTIQMFTWADSTVIVNDEITVKVRITDDAFNRSLHSIDGGIYGAEITILTGQFGNQLRATGGTTDIYGKYNGSILVASGEYQYREYVDVTVIAEWNDQYLSEQHKVWITVAEGN